MYLLYHVCNACVHETDCSSQTNSVVDTKVFIKASSRIVPIRVYTSFKTACQLTLR